MDTSIFTPLPRGYGGTDKNIQYYQFKCIECGSLARNCFCQPSQSQMLAHQMCFTCNYWRNFADTAIPKLLTIIDGCIYTPGTRPPHEFNGFGGRRFDIEYLENSVYSGQKCTTYDLWYGGAIPSQLKTKFSDTAKFLNITYPTGEEYPSPSHLIDREKQFIIDMER